MLSNDFYHINSFSAEAEEIYAEIKLNPRHRIFAGHFPGNPVTPGVCIMQIIKELTEKAVQTALQTEKVSNLKFKALINPEVNGTLHLHIKSTAADNAVKIKSTVTFAETTAVTMNAVYKRA